MRPCSWRSGLLSGVLGLLVASWGPTSPALAGAPPLDRPAPIRRLKSRPAGKFEPGLEARLRAADSGQRFTVLVDLTEQMDYRRLARRVRADRRPRAQRRERVIALFEQLAAREQAALLPEIDRWIDEGRLDFVRPVAIVNRLVVEGPADGILRLAGRSQVARVLADWHSRRPRGRRAPSLEGGRSLGERFENWGVAAVGADRLWAEGLDGSGVVVAAIDTGAHGEHEQLRGRQLPGGRGWFDPVSGSATPHDRHGHGTSVLSLAVGGNPGGRVVGLAPAARWAMALGNHDNYYSRSRMTLAADWVLRQARPDVVINAWSHDEEPCTEFDLPFINAWRAAGMFVVFPAGNAGPASGTGEAPAQLRGTFPDGSSVFSVAALTADDTVLRVSSRGPSACDSPEFPSLAAPGAELPHAAVGAPRNYLVGDGTSLSAGLVGGAAALLLQADPELEPWELERILIETARDLPPAGHDDDTGAGALFLPAALERVRARRDGSRR